MNPEKFSWRKRARSFGYAWQGIRALVRGEHNMWLHMTAAALAVAAGILLKISAGEWAAVIICIGAVMLGEAMNSAIEAVCDMVSPGPHPLIKKAKDMAAGGVLIMALAALVVGGIIFLPKIIDLIAE